MRKINFLLPLILLVHLLLLIHLRFTAWPEMTLWPYLLNKGLTAYRDIIIVYPPALIVVLSLLGKIFGTTLGALKIYTWLLILLSDLVLFLVAEKITRDKKTALVALIFYVLWQPFFGGNGLWFDLVLAPIGLAIFYSLWQKKFFGSGILLGLGFLVKQTSFWFLIPAIFMLWMNKDLRLKYLARFSFGVAVPIVALLVYLIKLGILPEFYQWVINYGLFYLPKATGQVLLPTPKHFLSTNVPYALFWLSIFTLIRYRNRVKESQILLLLTLWTFFGALGVFSRWDYFHLQPSLPFLAILSGMVISYINISYKKKFNLPLLAFILIVVVGTIYLQQRFYRLNWQKPTRFFEADILETAQWIKERTVPSEKIYILNSWDHLYALSDTLPAVSPLIHTLPWHLEYPGMQEKYVSDLANNKPKIIVFQPYSQTGLGSYKPAKIDKFIQENYNLSDIVAGRFWILKLK